MQFVHNLKYISSAFVCKQFFGRLTTYSPPIVRTSPIVNLRKISLLNKTSSEVNTNVAKDVMLYRYDNTKFYHILHAFAFSQFIFWTFIGHLAFVGLRDIPGSSDESLPWWRRINFGGKKSRIGITVTCVLIAYGIVGGSWLYTTRSVKFLVLHKGGQAVSLITNGLFGKSRTICVSLDKVSCEQSRHNARVQLPLRVKGYNLYFMLDMRGEFTNPRLFDYTAGLRRNLK